MPNDDKDIADVASSAGPEDVAAPAQAEVEAAKSSDATQSDNGDGDLLSVVRDAVDKNRKEPETPASPAEGEEAKVEDDPQEELSEEPSDEELAKYSSKTRRRIKQLLGERDAFKADAQNYRNVQGFLDAQGLTAEETANGLIIMGLAKTNPAEAWKQIKPWVQSILVAAGEVLPDDLKSMVGKGEISTQAALEVSRARAAQQSMEVQRQVEQQRSQQQSAQNAVLSLQNAAQAWENDRRLKDPNFDAKMEALQDRVYALQRREGVPNTPEGVKAQLDKAYKGLVAPAPAVTPARPAVAPVRGGQVAGNTAAEPTGLMDIIQRRGRV